METESNTPISSTLPIASVTPTQTRPGTKKALQEQVEKQGQQLDQLQRQLNKLFSLLSPGPNEPRSARQAIKPSTQQNQTQPQQTAQRYLWVRIKPYNPKKGFLRQREFIHELNCLFIGGTGRVGNIPVWYEVEEDVANRLRGYRQKQGSPFSPPVFDVVTLEQKMEIDAAEETWRRNQLGLAGTRDQKAVRAKEEQAKQHHNPEDDQPSLAEGAEAYLDGEMPAPKVAIGKGQTVASSVRREAPNKRGTVAASLPAHVKGRAAALEGLPAVQKNPDAIDLTNVEVPGVENLIEMGLRAKAVIQAGDPNPESSGEEDEMYQEPDYMPDFPTQIEQ